MPKVSEALVTMFVNITGDVNNADMLARYNANMEVQINVASGDGEPVAGKRNTWTDGITKYHHIRIPRNAHTSPEDNDYDLGFSIYQHAEHIGMTGWDWRNQVSRFVGFDFDSITNHAAGIGVDDSTLEAVKEAAKTIPWVQVRRSTSGSGLHLYAYFDDPFHTETHTEHAALGRAVLGLMATEVGFDFSANVDCAGGNLWVWSRRATEENGGFSLIKAHERGLKETDVPRNWRQNIDVVNRKRSKVKVSGVGDKEYEDFETLANSRKIVPLDDLHKEVIDSLAESGFSTIWVQDYHLLQAHTSGLKKVHADLGLEGFFNTTSSGTDPGTPNCFLFPLPDGVWKVYRFSPGIVEDPIWYQDGADWTSCYFNQKPSLETAAQASGGVRLADNKGFSFNTAVEADAAAQALGQSLDLDERYNLREAILTSDKSGRVVAKVKRYEGDTPPMGWAAPTKKWLERVLNVKSDSEKETINFYAYDDVFRNMTTPGHEDAGWMIRTGGGSWTKHSKDNVKSTLTLEHTSREIDLLLGTAILKPWKMVNLPFFPEYPGNRQWNYGAPQLKFAPSTDADDTINHPHWDKVLNHCGNDLNQSVQSNPWCKAAGIKTGGGYLQLWVASMVRNPFEPLPYLFFYGPQNSGKSIIHEAISTLMDGGITKADNALATKNDFNGELANAVLAIIEETDLSSGGNRAYNRIKDWVTSRAISIRKMRTDAYIQRNSLHFIQCANTIQYCPIFAGDTRITISHVPLLKDEIPKPVLIDKLIEEAPHFMRTLMDVIIPESDGRLRIPVLYSHNKYVAEELSKTSLETFMGETTYSVPGESIEFADFYGKFQEWLPIEEKDKWTKKYISNQLSYQYPTGKLGKNITYIGNLSWEKSNKDMAPLILHRGKLVPSTEFGAEDG